MTNRDPKGLFCDRGRMLSAWLPKLLDWGYSDALEVAIGVCIAYCAGEMADRLRIQANTLQEAPTEPPPYYAVRHYGLWSKRRDILIEALKKLRDVK